MVRAKFKCTANSTVGGTHSIRLEPVVSGSTENNMFYRYTPSGNIDLKVVSPETASGFIKGQEYYVDFSLVGQIQGELL